MQNANFVFDNCSLLDYNNSAMSDIGYPVLNKKRNRSINDNEPLNENGHKGIGIAKGSINQKDFGITVNEKDMGLRGAEKNQISQMKEIILKNLEKCVTLNPTVGIILDNKELLDGTLTVYFYNSLVRNKNNPNEQGYVILSVADVVLAKRDLEDEKLECDKNFKSLKEQKREEGWTDQQYEAELVKLRERIHRNVVLSYLKRHKGAKFYPDRFYQKQEGTAGNIKSILNNEKLLDEGSIEFLSKMFLTETSRTAKAFAISCVKNIILDEKPNDNNGQNVIAKKDDENDPKFSASFEENERKIDKLKNLIYGLNNEIKSKNFSEKEKNNIILKIGILGAYTEKLKRVSQRLLKNEHDGETIKNTYINSLPQVNVEWKQGEKDPFSENEKNSEMQINSNKKNSKSKKRVKFNDKKNSVLSFDKKDAPEKISGKSMEDILNNSKKKPEKSILLNYLRPIDAFDDGGTGDIRFDQNTRKIQFKNPDYDE